MPFQHGYTGIRLDIPDYDGRITTANGERFTIRAKGNCSDFPESSLPRFHTLPCLDIPEFHSLIIAPTDQYLSVGLNAIE